MTFLIRSDPRGVRERPSSGRLRGPQAGSHRVHQPNPRTRAAGTPATGSDRPLCRRGASCPETTERGPGPEKRHRYPTKRLLSAWTLFGYEGWGVVSVVVEFSIPAGDFVLGRALQRTSGLTAELEQMIPTGDRPIPYFWVFGDPDGQFEAVLEDDPALGDCHLVDRLDDRSLYRAEWDPPSDEFVQLIIDSDAVLWGAEGDADTWEFTLRFAGSHELSAFHTACREAGIDLDVVSLDNPIDPAGGESGPLTDAQASLIEYAYDQGYFEIPRQRTLAEIAEELDISDQAVNERLRRGLDSLVESTLK